MEPEGSLPHLRVPATCPYPEPDQSMSPPTTQLPEDTACVSISNYSPQEVIHFRVTKFPFL
jgi:hypothetical protein